MTILTVFSVTTKSTCFDDWSGEMSFATWRERYGCEVLHTSEGYAVPSDGMSLEARVDLYRLSDYLVAGLSGGMYWLSGE
jgi:hypothetical protein